MTGLNSLKLVSSKPAPKSNPREIRRQKLCKKLAEQLEMARCMKAGGVHEVIVKKRERDQETGETCETQRTKNLKPWWWMASDGKTHLTVRYGAKPLELAKGRNAIETDGIDGVIRTFEIIKTAVQSGELDLQIEGLTAKTMHSQQIERETLTLKKS